MEKKQTRIEKIIFSLPNDLQNRIIISQNLNAILINLIDSNMVEIEAALKESGRLTFAHKQRVNNIKNRTSAFVRGVDKEFGCESVCMGFGDVSDHLYDIFKEITFMDESNIEDIKRYVNRLSYRQQQKNTKDDTKKS